MKNKVTIGDRLKLLRTNLGISTKDISNVCLVDSLTYTRYEENIMYPSLEVQIKLSKFYNVTLGYLNGLEDIKEMDNNENKKEYIENVEYKDINLLSIPKLNLVKKIKTPYEKVKKGFFYYLYAPCRYSEYGINEKTLLLIKQISDYKSGNILLVEKSGSYFIGRCIKEERKLILCNPEFNEGFKEFKNDFSILGRIIEATLSL